MGKDRILEVSACIYGPGHDSLYRNSNHVSWEALEEVRVSTLTPGYLNALPYHIKNLIRNKPEKEEYE